MIGPGRCNNFDFLRIVAALMVIHGHGWVLSGGVAPGLWGIPFARVGVDVFFSISGYLVTCSWERTPRLWEYMSKRALRIFPGLIVCILATMLVVGPLATGLPLAAYFGSQETWRYLTNIGLYIQIDLPGVFEAAPEPGAVNGSIWSLLPEFVCYFTVPPLAAVTRGHPVARAWSLVVLSATIGGLALYLFVGYRDLAYYAYNLDLKYGMVEMPFFFIGSLLALIEPKSPGLWRADFCLLFFTLNYGVSAWFGLWNLPVEWSTLPYMVICFGRMSLPVIRSVGRFGDLSYGLYLYAFPIQQVILTLWPGFALPVLACVAVAIPLAFLSWHLVERPALHLRPPPSRSRLGTALTAAGLEQ